MGNQLLYNRYNISIKFTRQVKLLISPNSNWIHMGNIAFNQELFPYSSHSWRAYNNNNDQPMMIDEETGALALAQSLKDYDQHYIDCLQLRAKNSSYLVNVIAILDSVGVTRSNLSVNVACPMNFNQNQQIVVLIQNICYRLPDLGTLKYNEGIYILSQCVNGLKIISSKFARLDFQFQQEMIGFNKYGQCKVWFHSNYFKSLTLNQQSDNNENKTKIQKALQQIFCHVESRMSMQMNKTQTEQYAQLKTKFLGEIKKPQNFRYQIESSIQFCRMLCLSNKISIAKFKFQIPQLNEGENMGKSLLSLNMQNKSKQRKNQKYLFDKSKISLKVRLSESKKNGNIKRLEKQNKQVKIRNSLNNQKMCKLSFKNPEYQHEDQQKKQIDGQLKDSRSTFFTYQSQKEINVVQSKTASKKINITYLDSIKK